MDKENKTTRTRKTHRKSGKVRKNQVKMYTQMVGFKSPKYHIFDFLFLESTLYFISKSNYSNPIFYSLEQGGI